MPVETSNCRSKLFRYVSQRFISDERGINFGALAVTTYRTDLLHFPTIPIMVAVRPISRRRSTAPIVPRCHFGVTSDDIVA